MASRAEIEAQIAALKAVLKEKEIDPDFTPKELVRWDPTLLGTMLHMKHPMSIPRTGLYNAYKEDNDYSIAPFWRAGCRSQWNISEEMEMEQTCPLTHEGIMVNTDLCTEGVGKLIYTLENNFYSMTNVPIFAIIRSSREWFDDCQKFKILTCGELNIKVKYFPQVSNALQPPCIKGSLPLCGPDDNILDHIYIASVIKLPFQTNEFIIDKYPLSKLYEEWKADKVAGRTRRSA